MGLLNKKNIKNVNFGNKYNITEKDLIGNLRGFPIGVVVRMLEEQEKQEIFQNIKIFQNNIISFSGFNWYVSEAGFDFWRSVILDKNFNVFFEKYPKYKKYNK